MAFLAYSVGTGSGSFGELFFKLVERMDVWLCVDDLQCWTMIYIHLRKSKLNLKKFFYFFLDFLCMLLFDFSSSLNYKKSIKIKSVLFYEG
jgi:hypothetical protein